MGSTPKLAAKNAPFVKTTLTKIYSSRGRLFVVYAVLFRDPLRDKFSFVFYCPLEWREKRRNMQKESHCFYAFWLL